MNTARFRISRLAVFVVFALSATTALLISLYGQFFTAEGRGYTAFALLLFGLGTFIACVLALIADDASRVLLSRLWLLQAVVIVLVAVALGDGGGLALIYSIGAMCFPMSLLAPVVGLLADPGAGQANMLIFSALMIMLGYLQWFVLLPRLLRRFSNSAP